MPSRVTRGRIKQCPNQRTEAEFDDWADMVSRSKQGLLIGGMGAALLGSRTSEPSTGCTNYVAFARARHQWAASLTAFLFATITAPAWAEYLAYSITQADKSPLPEHLDGIDAKHLVNIEWGPFEGRKARVGVLEVDNTSGLASVRVDSGDGSAEVSLTGQQVPVNGIESIVIDTMARTGRFSLVERKILNEVLGEQDLGERVSRPSAAKVGKVLGAEFLLQVVVTDYEENTSGTGGGGIGALTRIPVLGGIGIKNSEGRIGLNFRLVDAQTSEVVHTKQLESIIRESGLLLGGGGFGGGIALGGFMGKYSKTPIGQAVIAGVNKGVFDLVREIGARPARGSIVKAEGNRIWLNLGHGALSVGDPIEVMSKGEELVDPETGISLGSMDTVAGRARVTDVQEKFSIARLDSTVTSVGRGDPVESLAPPPTIEFADAWEPPKRPKRFRRQ